MNISKSVLSVLLATGLFSSTLVSHAHAEQWFTGHGPTVTAAIKDAKRQMCNYGKQAHTVPSAKHCRKLSSHEYECIGISHKYRDQVRPSFCKKM